MLTYRGFEAWVECDGVQLTSYAAWCEGRVIGATVASEAGKVRVGFLATSSTVPRVFSLLATPGAVWRRVALPFPRFLRRRHPVPPWLTRLLQPFGIHWRDLDGGIESFGVVSVTKSMLHDRAQLATFKDNRWHSHWRARHKRHARQGGRQERVQSERRLGEAAPIFEYTDDRSVVLFVSRPFLTPHVAQTTTTRSWDTEL